MGKMPVYCSRGAHDGRIGLSMALVSTAMRAWTWRARQAVLVLGLLLCSSSLESSPPASALTRFGEAGSAQSASLSIRFSPAAGTFVGSETVSLTVQGDAAIHYTLDGSVPTAESPIYKAPVTLERSTRLRAVAIGRDGEPQGPVATEIYLRIDPDTQSFSSHLPIVLIHTFESGPLDTYGTEHVPAALMVLEPTSGTSRIVGRATVDARVGMRVRGESSRRFPKKQYAIELRSDADERDSGQMMLGLPSHSEWVMSDPVVYDRSLIRNALAFALSNGIGRYAPRTRFAEAYLVDDGGDVRASHFLGFFTLIEKIERDAQRVNVSRLPASATSAPAATGGFIVRIDKGAPDFDAGGRWLQFAYPDAEEMVLPERKPQLDFIRGFIDSFAQAAGAADFRHPATRQHYSEFIDVDAWIDHNIINALAKNVDALRISAYFHKERGGRLAAGPVWDFDRSMGTPYDPRATDAEEWNMQWAAADYFNEGWWRLLFRDPDFRSRYRARFKALLDGQLSPDRLDRIVDTLASEVGDASERNFRRWPQSPPLDNSHAAEISVLKDFLRRRVAWIKTQLDTNF
jgi:hypothetical protein